jgi:REP element-mobilizing transposase RayT
MDRYWLLTWTTYATWLPGDPRGFVSNIADDTGKGTRHNVPGTPCDADMPALRQYMQQRLKGNPVYLDRSQANLLLKQFQETATYRGWSLLAAAVMPNHVHLVVAVAGDPDPASLLRDFKSYGSRALNRRWGEPIGGTWWTESGSRRKLRDDAAVQAAVRYVQEQANALVIWASGGRQPPVAEQQQASGGRQPPVVPQQGANAPRSPEE